MLLLQRFFCHQWMVLPVEPDQRLGGCLRDQHTHDPGVEEGLKAYELERLPATADVVLHNRRGGPEMVIDKVEELAPEGFSDIESVIALEERRRLVEAYATVAGYARGQVNASPGMPGAS